LREAGEWKGSHEEHDHGNQDLQETSALEKWGSAAMLTRILVGEKLRRTWRLDGIPTPPGPSSRPTVAYASGQNVDRLFHSGKARRRRLIGMRD